ncbi:MAG: DUF1697 domain-containing protein [Pyrinomonadaceae bacterium]
MKYVALLRGINVGGNNMIKMETLRSTFESLGFENVTSYINSGNLSFEASAADDAVLAKKIHDAIQSEFEFDISVMVRSSTEIDEIIANNPYIGQFESDKDMHVFFLASELSSDQTKSLLEKNSEEEMIAVNGRTIYYLLKMSIIDSVLGKGFIDKKIKVPATARNWRTVKKLAEM